MPRSKKYLETLEEAPMEVQDAEEEETEEEDLAADDLMEKAGAIAAEISRYAKSDKSRARRLTRDLEKLLASVKVTDMPELAESPAIRAFAQMVAPRDLKPGETRNAGTLAEVGREWSMEDLRAFPKKTFVPMESLTITWNGIPCMISAGEEVSIPEPFYDIYRDHLKAQRNARQHELYMLGKSNVAPDRNWMTDATMRVRGWTELGKGSLGTGPIRDEDAMGPDNAGEADNG